MADVIVEDRDDGVRVVRFNRPDRLNALTPDMVSTITRHLNDAVSHRAVLLTGNGRGFCAGVDIAGADERQRGRSNADGLAMQERFGRMILAVAQAPCPVVSAVNGPAAGAGLALSLASDIRLAGRSARFLIGAPRIGLSAGECGISYFLPRLIGTGRAAEWMLTNRTVSATEALELGLVTTVVDDDELGAVAEDTLARIVALSPFGQKMTKQVYRRNIDAPSLDAALDVENRTQILANSTVDAAEARAAFLEKRPPVYIGR
ncbi:enoyl-CoA hydratase-related protein [Nocardia zapadnayensis]|uniref:enoyl-CoA hydratase/isomerase family protein n=1 Tax=Nocardia rhamnosiphila TaxID=426716 RepID=UPI0022452746|nr:enoyl-CoA hydratase-related protein [Nocardia zapadnayensis]MCX0272743.1 enoyl-CoA hydratase-related protein [Nocardia zapadnayensis]